MASSNESIRRMHLTLARLGGEATCQYYDLIPYVSDFPSGATYHVDYYPIMGSLMTEFVKLTLQYRIYKTAEADTGGEKENDLSSRDGHDPAAKVNTDWRSTWDDDGETLLHEFLMSLVSKTHLWLYKCDQIDTRALPDLLQKASIYTILDQQMLKDIQLPSSREKWLSSDPNPPPRAEVVICQHRLAAEQEDTWADNRSFSIKGYPETYAIEALPGWVAEIGTEHKRRRKICLVSYDYRAEVISKTPTNERELLREWYDQFDVFELDSDYYDDDSEEESQESDENFAMVEWTPDCVDGIEDDSFGLVKFKHRGSGSTFEGVPRGQLVCEGKYTGFVVITEVAEKRRTLAIRDHDLLQEYAPNCARPHPSPPKIVPLVGHQLDAIFELAYSRGGEIEAFPMKYED
ncbi:hypothetical protein KC318_g792 [Hortaea werneckii]|nr:hypothetical protein KC334_g10448 [Hortaea werneckii]KAI7027160.1 hypothetical protein KC355_g423 [Hortaea werneckii]KAI7675682.1 hypothetical protein KC318_g792 [Hortaea werneckii]